MDIPSRLLELRNMRMGMVQTPEQLRFCYQAILLGKKRLNVETPAATQTKQRPDTLQLVHENPDVFFFFQNLLLTK